MTTQKRPFAYNIGDSVINKTNWQCYIVDRKVADNGVNIYIVESEEDEDIDGFSNIIDGERWELKEYEIARLAD